MVTIEEKKVGHRKKRKGETISSSRRPRLPLGKDGGRNATPGGKKGEMIPTTGKKKKGSRNHWGQGLSFWARRGLSSGQREKKKRVLFWGAGDRVPTYSEKGAHDLKKRTLLPKNCSVHRRE